MTVSETIKALQDIKDAYGDVKVTIYHPENLWNQNIEIGAIAYDSLTHTAEIVE